ncbi:hypothetical protein C1645_760726 [Glomus cerebriforme]|uniref:Uncharacterized protein n=1 Tax=Glomus cerebriforme TaxID=658196 RepID=A0A397TB33_9GLOM|nr:hypothetical protein C1645_760726 [Glomus cerebriforme]
MIMYYVATGRQPFADCAHDYNLSTNICKEIRPEINEPEAPKCYIDLMKRCWSSNHDNRPNITEIEELIDLFIYSCSNRNYKKLKPKHYEIKKQFEEAEEFRRTHLLSTDIDQSTTHPQAIYTSQLHERTKDFNIPDDIDFESLANNFEELNIEFGTG